MYSISCIFKDNEEKELMVEFIQQIGTQKKLKKFFEPNLSKQNDFLSYEDLSLELEQLNFNFGNNEIKSHDKIELFYNTLEVQAKFITDELILLFSWISKVTNNENKLNKNYILSNKIEYSLVNLEDVDLYRKKENPHIAISEDGLFKNENLIIGNKINILLDIEKDYKKHLKKKSNFKRNNSLRL